MQNSTLPLFSGTQAASANSAPPRQNSNSSNASDAAQFAQTLSRQVEQRQQQARAAAAPAAPAPTPAAPAPRPTITAAAAPACTMQQGAPTDSDAAATDEAVASDSSSAATASATPTPAKASAAASKDGADAKDSGEQADADLADASPMAGLIAIVASFNQAADAKVAPVDAKAVPVDAQAMAAGALAGKNGGDGARSLAQMFDHARGAKSVASAVGTAGDGAAAGAGKAAKAAVSGEGAATVAADTTDSAASKGADFAGQLQAKVDGAASRGEALASKVDTATVRELPAAATAAAPLSAPVQQASLALAQAAGQMGDRLSARVGTPAWDNQVGQKIIWMAAGQEQSATLTLNPPDLGPVQVVLSVSNDQAQVTFSSAQPEVRAALEQAMPRLRDMMGESGLTLGNASVNDGAAEQRQAQQDDQGRGRGGRGLVGAAADSQGGVIEAPARRGRVLGGDGAVDTFA